jgi:hypothetical protein
MLRLTTLLLLAVPCLHLLVAGENLAAGKPCAFSPTPNYGPTAAGETDTADLTDGKLTQRPDQHIWFEAASVGWTYTPVANLRLDLGQVQPIGEVVMRLQGGSPQPGIDFPGYVKLLVSDDDVSYHQVAEYSKWRPGDDRAYGLPETTGKGWVHPLRFAGLKTRGRYVGLVLGGAGFTLSDELYVYRGDHDAAQVAFDPASRVDFSVSRPQVAFVKPALILTANLATPQPVVLLDCSGVKRKLTLHLRTPPGVALVAGAVGTAQAADAAREQQADGSTAYTLTSESTGTAIMPWGKLWLQASLPAGAKLALQAWLDWGEGTSPVTTIPATVAVLPPAPPCKRLMLALGWWAIESTKAWPDGLAAARIIGLNTLSTFTMWMPKDDPALWDYAQQARQQGFKLLNVDSAWHQMLSLHKGDTSLFCQFAAGTTGTSFCPSYRGPAYVEELQRIGTENARLQPDYLSEDVELWSWQGPLDAEKCTRCQADKAKTGLKTWEEWKLAKGYAMWQDLHRAVQEAVRAAGGKPVAMGCYDWRPAKDYQFFWPFDRLYADKLVHSSQVSTYTSLLPYHVELVGNEAREDRRHVPRTEGLPWLSPGDAGAFTAEALRCAMLECFLNGSRGIHFWSNRYWDGEYFLGYNQAARAVAAVEDIIMDGQLYEQASAPRPARVSGMVRGKDIALLVGEYYGTAPATVPVTLEVPAPSAVIDAESGQAIGELAAGKQTLNVSLDEHRSRVLWLRGK